MLVNKELCVNTTVLLVYIGPHTEFQDVLCIVMHFKKQSAAIRNQGTNSFTLYRYAVLLFSRNKCASTQI